jgi:hypothetical protein
MKFSEMSDRSWFELLYDVSQLFIGLFDKAKET